MADCFIIVTVNPYIELTLIMRSPTELLEIKPAKEYCSLSPDERIDTSEYKKLFFEIVENLKYEK